MAGETVITVIGNLTADPELRTIPSGATVANFTIASTPRTFDRQSNQWKDGDSLFLRCSAWDSDTRTPATNIAQSLAKGMRVIAQGRLSQRSYTDDQNNRHTVTELRVDEIGPALSRYQTVAERTPAKTASGYHGGASGLSPQDQAGETNQDPWGHPADYGAAGEPDF